MPEVQYIYNNKTQGLRISKGPDSPATCCSDSLHTSMLSVCSPVFSSLSRERSNAWQDPRRSQWLIDIDRLLMSFSDIFGIFNDSFNSTEVSQIVCPQSKVLLLKMNFGQPRWQCWRWCRPQCSHSGLAQAWRIPWPLAWKQHRPDLGMGRGGRKNSSTSPKYIFNLNRWNGRWKTSYIL